MCCCWCCVVVGVVGNCLILLLCHFHFFSSSESSKFRMKIQRDKRYIVTFFNNNLVVQFIAHKNLVQNRDKNYNLTLFSSSQLIYPYTNSYYPKYWIVR